MTENLFLQSDRKFFIKGKEILRYCTFKRKMYCVQQFSLRLAALHEHHALNTMASNIQLITNICSSSSPQPGRVHVSAPRSGLSKPVGSGDNYPRLSPPPVAGENCCGGPTCFSHQRWSEPSMIQTPLSCLNFFITLFQVYTIDSSLSIYFCLQTA